MLIVPTKTLYFSQHYGHVEQHIKLLHNLCHLNWFMALNSLCQLNLWSPPKKIRDIPTKDLDQAIHVRMENLV
jgi:hypothetical protein